MIDPQIKLPGFCHICNGHGECVTYKTKLHPTGYMKCEACIGTGYGETLEEYWERNGINCMTPAMKTKPAAIRVWNAMQRSAKKEAKR